MFYLWEIVRRNLRDFDRKLYKIGRHVRRALGIKTENYILTRLRRINWLSRLLECEMNQINLNKREQIKKCVMRQLDKVKLHEVDEGVSATDQKHLHSVMHEAGHVVISWLATKHLLLAQASRDSVTNTCFTHPENPSNLKTTEEVVAMMAMHLAGSIAEKLCIKDANIKFVGTDLKWVTVYSTTLATLNSEKLFLCGIPSDQIRNYSQVHGGYWVKKAFRIAHKFLKEHVDDVMKVARGFVLIGTLNMGHLTNILGPQVYVEEPQPKKTKTKK